MTRYFIPFTQVRKHKAIIVDSMHPNGLVLSHWRGALTPPELRDDTSGGIVLNALRQNIAGLACEAVTANHFDIDGFVGVWGLLNPDLALEYEKVLRAMALIGDFRELNLELPEAELALKLVCWLNAQEKALFYPPFGTEEMEENEVIASVPKFDYFLREFGNILKNPEAARLIWEPEYNQVKTDNAALRKAATSYSTYPGIGLVVINTPEPVHYYALFSLSAGYDMVLAKYEGNRYELEYKYTTWIDLDSRPTLPRVTLSPLVNALNAIEKSDLKWTGESITDTGPILRLGGSKLLKMQRYANPTERPIYASSVEPAALEEIITDYYQQAYSDVNPKKYWSWEEIKNISRSKEKARSFNI